MKKFLLSVTVMLIVMVSLAVLPGEVKADATDEARKAAERAVASTLSEVLSETVSQMQESPEAKNTLFATPSFTRVELSGDLGVTKFDADVDIKQVLAGAILPINDKLFFTGSISYSWIDLDIDAAQDSGSATADFVLIDAGLVAVLASSDTFKSWVNFGVNYGNFAIEDIDVDMYGAKAGVSFDNSLTDKLSLMSNIGVNVSKADVSGAKEAWAMEVSTKLKYQVDAITPSLEVKYQHGFASDSGADDTMVANISPAIDYQVSEALTTGLSYTYSTLLNSSDFGFDVDSHTAALNLKYKF